MSDNQEPLNALPGLSDTHWDYTSGKFIKKTAFPKDSERTM